MVALPRKESAAVLCLQIRGLTGRFSLAGCRTAWSGRPFPGALDTGESEDGEPASHGGRAPTSPSPHVGQRCQFASDVPLSHPLAEGVQSECAINTGSLRDKKTGIQKFV